MDAKRWLRWLGAAGGAGAALLALSLLTERRRLRVVRRTYAVSGLPPDLDSLRVAHLSDLHAGPWVPTSLLAGAVAAANAERPDVVLLTGDYVDLDRTFADVCAEVLGHLRAPHGVYAVLGNHDHEAGAERMVAALQARGITVLPNRAVPLGQGPTHLWVVGLDDTVSHRGDLREALAEVAPGDPVVLLSHSPDLVYRAADHGITLVLAGHTHGGQLRVPGMAFVYSPSRFGPHLVGGSIRVGRTRMYVSHGLGVNTLPIRFRCPPEVGLYTLVRPAREPAAACGRGSAPDAGSADAEIEWPCD